MTVKTLRRLLAQAPDNARVFIQHPDNFDEYEIADLDTREDFTSEDTFGDDVNGMDDVVAISHREKDLDDVVIVPHSHNTTTKDWQSSSLHALSRK